MGAGPEYKEHWYKSTNGITKHKRSNLAPV